MISMRARNGTCVLSDTRLLDTIDSALENIALFFASMLPLARSGQSFLNDEKRSTSPSRIQKVERQHRQTAAIKPEQDNQTATVVFDTSQKL